MTDRPPPPRRPTLQGFASIHPLEEGGAPQPIEGAEPAPVPAQADHAPGGKAQPPITVADETARVHPAGTVVRFGETSRFGEPLAAVTAADPASDLSAAAALLVGTARGPVETEPALPRAAKKAEYRSGWTPSVSVGPALDRPDRPRYPEGTLAGIPAPDLPTDVAQAEGQDGEEPSGGESHSSYPPSAIVRPVIQVSGPAAAAVVTTQGEAVHLGSTGPTPNGPMGPTRGKGPSQHDPPRPVMSTSSMALVQSLSRAVALTTQESGPTVMRALLAAVDVLQPGRGGDESWQTPSEALALPPAAARPVSVTLVEAPPLARRRQLTAVDLPNSNRAESFRLLRHRLKAAGDPRVIGVASPGGGGETAICAAELALAYADSSAENVLLLEFDTHRPRLARLLGLSVEYCFAMQMYDKYDGSPEPWRAVSVFRSNLHVLPISPTLMAGEHLFPPVFQCALSDLARAPYGRIVVVCPKVLDSADIGVIEGHVDGLLLTGPAGHTKAADLRRAAQQVAPTAVFGVALLEPD